MYNGNIAETVWRTQSDFTKRAYQYKYDGLNRITGANFRENNSLTTNTGKFDTEYGYDQNGNLQDLIRKGSNGQDIDELSYGYTSNTNKLFEVNDDSGNITGFESSSNYTYDSNNGNLIADTGKGITNIEYNHLDLPTKVHFGTTKRIEYIYTAGGAKLEKKVINGFTSTTHYAGSFIYENNLLKHFSHPEGYVEFNNGNFNYVYQYADHIGNIRLNYTNTGSRTFPSLQIKEENNYYPFGMKHEGYNNAIVGVQNDNKYNGKELQDEVINGKKLQWYDYGARNYDPSIGRFFNIDPLADSPMQIDKSPYAYVWNNPIKLTDPSGMHPEMEEEDERRQGAGNYFEFGQGASIGGDGIHFSTKRRKSNTEEGNVTYVAIMPDGTQRVISPNEAKKALENGAQWGGYEYNININSQEINSKDRDKEGLIEQQSYTKVNLLKSKTPIKDLFTVIKKANDVGELTDVNNIIVGGMKGGEINVVAKIVIFKDGDIEHEFQIKRSNPLPPKGTFQARITGMGFGLLDPNVRNGYVTSRRFDRGFYQGFYIRGGGDIRVSIGAKNKAAILFLKEKFDEYFYGKK